MFTNVAVQVKAINTNVLTAVVRQYLSCCYFGKVVVNVYRACALSLVFNTLLSILSSFRDSYFMGGGGGGGLGAGISAQSPNFSSP